MAGIKGKSGLRKSSGKGPGKGKTNNPRGKPSGVKNKVPATVKKRIIEYIERDFDQYLSDLNSLDVRDRVKAFTELVKLVVPRPVSEEELDAIRGSQSAVVLRLFPKNAD
jgi:DNA-binding protein Fis